MAEPGITVLGGGGMTDPDSAVLGGGGIKEQEERAVLGGGGITDPDSAVLGGSGISDPDSAVHGGGGISDPDSAVLGGGGITGPSSPNSNWDVLQVQLAGELSNSESGGESISSAPRPADQAALAPISILPIVRLARQFRNRPRGVNFLTRPGGPQHDPRSVPAEQIPGEFQRLARARVGGPLHQHQRRAQVHLERLGLARPGGHRFQALPGPVRSQPVRDLEQFIE